MLEGFNNSRRLSLCLLGTLAFLTSCEWLEGKERQPPVKHPPRVEASTFVQQLALARLSIGEEEEASLKKHTKALETYTAQKTKKAARQPVVILEYQAGKASGIQKLLAPIRVPSEKPEFPALLEIMQRLTEQSHTLRDVHLNLVSVATTPPLKLAGIPLKEARLALNERQKILLRTRKKLRSVEEARSLMQLTRFFMTHKYRDAAYLSLDNAKQALADAARETSEKSDGVSDLSQQLSVLEIQLHEALPF